MKRMALILTAVVTLAGCGAATAERPTARVSATPTTDMTRQACHLVSAHDPDDIDASFDPNAWLATAQAATKATDPGVQEAGQHLLHVAAANEQISEDDRRGMPNINLARATLKLSQACINLYGDGPW
jgi:hypothetical protein